jgi:hypothetical protein
MTLLAASAGQAEQLKIPETELATLSAKLAAHWHPDMSVFLRPDQCVVVVRFQLDRDGRLSAPVQVVSTGSGPLYRSAAEAAKRAVELSQPFDMLSLSTYDAWKDLTINFNPRAMGTAPSH